MKTHPLPFNFEQVAGPFDFTEGPAWDGTGLLFTDIPNNKIMRFDPVSGETVVFLTDTNETTGLMLDKDGRLYGCEGGQEGRRVVRYDADEGTSIVASHLKASG